MVRTQRVRQLVVRHRQIERQDFTDFGKVLSVTLRDDLWDVAVDQYGYVTALDAHQFGAAVVELGKLAARGKLTRVAYGLYRFPEWPTGSRDHLMEAVLWTRDPDAALSHDTALDVYELSDINPGRIHVTVARKSRPLRRRQTPAAYVVHYEDLAPSQRGFWEQIPTVTVPTAIDQCIASGVRPDLIRQAIAEAREQGLIDPETAARQRSTLTGGHQ
jgi:predicted transcriptional regulator of viral defense system